MNIQANTIYRKDCRLLMSHLLGAMIIQALILFLMPYMQWELMRIMGRSRPYLGSAYDWVPMVQIAVNVLIALVASVYWMSEERAGGNDLFLRRLPISSNRVNGEKFLAGLSVIMLALAIQTIWSYASSLFGVRIWQQSAQMLFYLTVTSLFAYLTGILLSRVIKQSIAIILTGIPVVGVFIWSLPYYEMEMEYGTINLLFILFFLIYLILLFTGVVNVYPAWKQEPSNSVLKKQIRLNTGWIILTFILFTLTLLYTEIIFLSRNVNLWQFLPMFIFPSCFIFSGLIGIYTYRPGEKDGIRCMIYHHAISRSHIFWSHYGLGLLLSSLISFGMALASTAVFYVSVFHAPDATPIVAILFQAVILTFLIGLVPYCCGALITHAISGQLYAIMQTVAAFIFTASTLYYFLSPAIHLQERLPLDLHLIYSTNTMPMFPHIVFTLLVALAGFTLAAWRTATDPGVSTGTTLYRQIYVARLFLFLLAFIVVYIKTGWFDFLYLTTGIDLGIG